jgi:hypothetical protein
MQLKWSSPEKIRLNTKRHLLWRYRRIYSSFSSANHLRTNLTHFLTVTAFRECNLSDQLSSSISESRTNLFRPTKFRTNLFRAILTLENDESNGYKMVRSLMFHCISSSYSLPDNMDQITPLDRQLATWLFIFSNAPGARHLAMNPFQVVHF